MSLKSLRGLLLAPLALMLSGCNLVLLHPAGVVAVRQRNLMIASVALMLLIIVPVLIAVAVIAWRYRASAHNPDYAPEWEHSTKLELVVWAAPLLIIIALGAMTWIGTHQLDPYRPVERIDATHRVPAGLAPLRVEVVSLNWKWLFFYPDYGIATVNELAAPVDTPIDFKLTSPSTMNSFFVPALAGQIYTMPGMQTVLHALINKPGNYKGFSANFSGSGFTDMRFRFLGMSAADFANWVSGIKAGGGNLDRRTYDALAKPSKAEPVHRYASYARGLYSRILNHCVDPGQMCMGRMMAIDAHGGRPLGQGGMDMGAGAPR
ncbi:MAG: ubiquinol oxidase subunit II [Steroidobacteraceae bacterium]|nr:ubiquinol oxidase subunit II [Steroidobacteraceae bacterium]